MPTQIDSSISTLTADEVTGALRQVPYPGLTRDIVSFGMVEHVEVCDGRVDLRLGVHTRDAQALATLERSIHEALQPVGATAVSVRIVPPAPSTALPTRRRECPARGCGRSRPVPRG